MIANTTKIALAALMLVVTSAPAEVLWDQSVLDPAGPGQANSVSPGFNGFVVYGVSDVTVDGSGWSIQAISTYYSTWNPDWVLLTEGHLHVFPKTGPLPTDDPTASSIIPLTASQDGDVLTITASGLDIPLAPGEYWVGITPFAPAGALGANQQYSTAQIGDPVATYLDGAWDNFYPGYDGAILVEGTRPTPVEDTTWGDVKALYR